MENLVPSHNFKSKQQTKQLAFVVPRYGQEIGGGAETLVRTLAEHLCARGDSIQIWTTCAKDNRAWANEFPAGKTVEQGIEVWRFPVNDRNLERWVPLQINISEGMNLSLEDQLDWMAESVNSAGLYDHIASQADSVDAIFFAPYLFGTTFWGSLIRPDKSILIPCLHNESYAYIDIIQSMFRQVKGCIFNAIPEQELACALYGNTVGAEVGMGFEPFQIAYVDQLTPYFLEERPYLLYMGRKETGKNVQVLLDAFILGKERGKIQSELKLVIAGGGSFEDLHRPEALDREDIVDLAHVSEKDKHRLIKHALCLCQPSVNESFSIVLMEAWALGTPVVVHSNCAVTRYHVSKSGGGLYFATPQEFAGVIELMQAEPSIRSEMAAAGKSYVDCVYSWEAVLDRFNQALELLGV